MTDTPEQANTDEWPHSPYDTKTITEIVHDFAVTRGDLCEQYARDQLVTIIERRIEEARMTPEVDPATLPVPLVPRVTAFAIGVIQSLHTNLGKIENHGTAADRRDIDSARVYLEGAYWKLGQALMRHDQPTGEAHRG